MEKRGLFSSKLGFILAAAGSAVGLGNIWRFPYLATKYGGGIFLLFYIIFVLTVGFTLMITEIAIGRKTGLSSLKAFSKLKQKWWFLGVIPFLVSFIILPYYSVIGGWVLKYLIAFFLGNHSALASTQYFSGFISSPIEPIIYQVLFILAVLVVVLGGVKNGIEKANKFIMPILIVLCLIVSIYSLTLPNAIDGLKYYLLPDFSKFSIEGVLAALGQMFYSLSLAMGIMITYGSYLSKDTDIEKSVARIEVFDTGIAMLAGFMIIPAVFAFSGGDLSTLNAGPSLMFITLPKVFESMGAASFIGTIFFLLVFFAALTSAISMMETLVSNVIDYFKISRIKAILILSGLVFLVGIPSSLGEGVLSFIKIGKFSILDFNDYITNSILMPIAAILTSIFVGYIIDTKIVINEIEMTSKFRRKKMYIILLKFVVPVMITTILITSLI